MREYFAGALSSKGQKSAAKTRGSVVNLRAAVHVRELRGEVLPIRDVPVRPQLLSG